MTYYFLLSLLLVFFSFLCLSRGVFGPHIKSFFKPCNLRILLHFGGARLSVSTELIPLATGVCVNIANKTIPNNEKFYFIFFKYSFLL